MTSEQEKDIRTEIDRLRTRVEEQEAHTLLLLALARANAANGRLHPANIKEQIRDLSLSTPNQDADKLRGEAEKLLDAYFPPGEPA